MQITINVSDKVIKSALKERLNNDIYECYDDSVLKVARLPKINTVVNEAMTDQLATALTKDMAGWLAEMAEEEMYNAIYDVKVPQIDSLEKKVMAAVTATAKQREQQQQQEQQDKQAAQDAVDLERTIKALKKLGYRIEKI